MKFRDFDISRHTGISPIACAECGTQMQIKDYDSEASQQIVVCVYRDCKYYEIEYLAEIKKYDLELR